MSVVCVCMCEVVLLHYCVCVHSGSFTSCPAQELLTFTTTAPLPRRTNNKRSSTKNTVLSAARIMCWPFGQLNFPNVCSLFAQRSTPRMVFLLVYWFSSSSIILEFQANTHILHTHAHTYTLARTHTYTQSILFYFFFFSFLVFRLVFYCNNPYGICLENTTHTPHVV